MPVIIDAAQPDALWRIGSALSGVGKAANQFYAIQQADRALAQRDKQIEELTKTHQIERQATLAHIVDLESRVRERDQNTAREEGYDEAGAQFDKLGGRQLGGAMALPEQSKRGLPQHLQLRLQVLTGVLSKMDQSDPRVKATRERVANEEGKRLKADAVTYQIDNELNLIRQDAMPGAEGEEPTFAPDYAKKLSERLGQYKELAAKDPDLAGKFVGETIKTTDGHRKTVGEDRVAAKSRLKAKMQFEEIAATSGASLENQQLADNLMERIDVEHLTGRDIATVMKEAVLALHGILPEQTSAGRARDAGEARTRAADEAALRDTHKRTEEGSGGEAEAELFAVEGAQQQSGGAESGPGNEAPAPEKVDPAAPSDAAIQQTAAPAYPRVAVGATLTSLGIDPGTKPSQLTKEQRAALDKLDLTPEQRKKLGLDQKKQLPIRRREWRAQQQ